MKTDTYLAMESLINCSRKLMHESVEIGTDGDPRFSAWPLDVASWYCRTHIYSCPEEKEEETVQELAEGVKSKKLPWLVSISTEDVSDRFVQLLEQAGFVIRAPQAGMLLETAAYEAKPLDPHVIMIGEDRIDEWADASSKGFGTRFEKEAMRGLVKDPSCRFYAYVENDEIIATLMMSYQPGNAGLHEVATLKECRGRGACKALLNRAFIDAREMGYELMSLQASPLGEPVYRSIGMRVVSHIRTYQLAE